jgi:predicted SAM-dependent methyltransferase
LEVCIKLLNLACGNSAVFSNEWENCDFAPFDKRVRQIDLMNKLPYKNETFDLVYSSHFIEHIRLENLQFFLDECYRILKVGGVIRLVLPDFENIVREYLTNLENNQILFSQFNIVELIDQCTRNFSGGELLKWYSDINNSYSLKSYVAKRTGLSARLSKENSKTIFFKRIQNITFKKINIKLQKKIVFTLIKFFPHWFKDHHVSYTETGERHLWMHDFNSLSSYLKKSNFREITKLSAYQSSFSSFPIFPLDLNDQNTPNKGESSMYLEAVKK